jgi:hypothetical protein
MAFLKRFFLKRKVSRDRKAIESALDLHCRGEVRRDGLALTQASHRLEIEWRARDVHPWDRACDPGKRECLFAEQFFADTDAALSGLFDEMPEIDVIEFRVIHPDSGQRILSGTVVRKDRVPGTRGFSARTRLWHRGVTLTFIVTVVLALGSGARCAQSQIAKTGPESDASNTSTDLFIMVGSDFDRPGLLPRANYNIGIGHTFGFLKKDPIGDELTFGYTYENAGTHGFLHSAYGEHTESAGVMKNFSLPRTKTWTGYTWIQSGITSFTGNSHIQNRLDSGVSLGAIAHFNNNNSLWLQESYSKVVTVSWYTTSSIGYTYSW